MATTALTLKQVEEVGSAIDEAVKNCQLAENSSSTFARSILMARGIREIKDRMNADVMRDIMPLMNSGLGFRTDKDPRVKKKDRDGNWTAQQPYGEDVVKECLAEALIKGAYPVGNEFNIIAGRAYFTREYFKRKCAELPGVTEFVAIPGIPKTAPGGAVVPFRVTCKIEGKPQEFNRELPIKVNEMMGADAILGKAERKMLRWVYETITGSKFSVPDGDVEGDGTAFIDVTATSQPVQPGSTGAASQNAAAEAVLRQQREAQQAAEAAKANNQPPPPDSDPTGNLTGEDFRAVEGEQEELPSTEAHQLEQPQAGGEALEVPDPCPQHWFKELALKMKPPTMTFGEAGRRVDGFLKVGMQREWGKTSRANQLTLINSLQDPATCPVWR